MVLDKENQPETRSTQQMLSPEPPDHIHVAFDDHHLVANAGLTGPTAALRWIRAKGTCSNHLWSPFKPLYYFSIESCHIPECGPGLPVPCPGTVS